MSKKLELSGKTVGKWKVDKFLKIKEMDCGSTRSLWLCICLNCGNEFEETSKRISRKIEPHGCMSCIPGHKPMDGGRVLHYSEISCGTRGVSFRYVTNDMSKVNCTNCLRKMR